MEGLIALTQSQARWALLGLLLIFMAFAAIGLFVLGFFVGTAGTMKEYERGVVYVLGRLRERVIGPGLFWRPPFISTIVRVDMRAQDLPLDVIEVTMAMNVRARLVVSAQVHVTDPIAAVNQSADYLKVMADLVTDTFQTQLSSESIDKLIGGQKEFLAEVRGIVAMQAAKWGTQLAVLVIRSVEWPEVLEKALAREASATYDLKGDVVRAAGESTLAPSYLAAAKQWLPDASTEEQIAYAFELRRMATLEDMGSGASVVVADATRRLPTPTRVQSDPASEQDAG